MSNKSAKIALGGVFSALCLLLMFMSGVIPFSQYAMPALAGATLAAVCIENGRKAALAVYVSVSLLSLFVVPDREAAVMFAVFFGYYPVLKGILETLKSRLAEYFVKLLIFNLAIVGAYMVLIFVFGIPMPDDLPGEWGKYSAAVLLAAGNVTFIIYDFALSRYITLYVRRFRPRFLRK